MFKPLYIPGGQDLQTRRFRGWMVSGVRGVTLILGFAKTCSYFYHLSTRGPLALKFSFQEGEARNEGLDFLSFLGLSPWHEKGRGGCGAPALGFPVGHGAEQ